MLHSGRPPFQCCESLRPLLDMLPWPMPSLSDEPGASFIFTLRRCFHIIAHGCGLDLVLLIEPLLTHTISSPVGDHRHTRYVNEQLKRRCMCRQT